MHSNNHLNAIYKYFALNIILISDKLIKHPINPFSSINQVNPITLINLINSISLINQNVSIKFRYHFIMN